jgi:hypothetical protein
VGPEHEVHLREALEQGRALLLRHAASDPEDPPGRRLLPGAQHTEVAVEPVLRLLADGAGIHQQQIRLLQRVGRAVAVVMEQVRDLPGVVDVHLAAEGAQGEALGNVHRGLLAHRAGAGPRLAQPPAGPGRPAPGPQVTLAEGWRTRWISWPRPGPGRRVDKSRLTSPGRAGMMVPTRVPSNDSGGFWSGGGLDISARNVQPLTPHHLSTALPL